MPSALPADHGAVPYDAYSPDHLHDQPAPSTHPPHQHQPQQPAEPAVRQRWYELSDGAVTPPDDSSSSSHRGDFVGHVPVHGALAHSVTAAEAAAKRRPLGCRLVAGVGVDVLLIAALAVAAYFLRSHRRLYIQRSDVTESLWSRYDRHFVGIALSYISCYSNHRCKNVQIKF